MKISQKTHIILIYLFQINMLSTLCIHLLLAVIVPVISGESEIHHRIRL